MSENKNIKDLVNLYEVRKTVRFELKPEFLNPPKIQKSQNFENDLNSFIEKYKKVIGNFSEIVFDFSKENLNKKLKINFSFLKTYTKNLYYENNIENFIKYNKKGQKNTNKIKIGDTTKLNYLLKVFKDFEENNMYILENIEKTGLRDEHNKSRKADLAYYFHQISKKTNFKFIKDLFNDNINIEGDLYKKIDETKDLLFKIEKLILIIEKTLLPSSSIGEIIEKASFNYYTVNKKPRDYDEEILKKKNDFNKPLTMFKNKNGELIFDITKILNLNNKISELDESFFNKIEYRDNKGSLKNYEIKKEIEYLNEKAKYLEFLKIKNAYELMKEYKAIQKSNFLEYLNERVKSNESDLDISLFNDILEEKNKEKYRIILNLTKAILILSQAKTDKINLKKANNQEEKEIEIQENLEKYNNEFGDELGKVEKDNFFEKITKIKKIRGEYFFEGDPKFIFNKYGEFCKEYKKIAMEFGKIKAKIKSLEKEKVDAEKTDSWAFILENKNNKYLLTIPRIINDSLKEAETNLNKAKTEINNLKNEIKGDWILYKFESLTLRSLDKLCFGKENNSFRPTLFSYIIDKKFLNEKTKKLKEKFEFTKEINGEKIKDEKLLLEFYKTVLNLESTQKQIVIKYFEGFDEFIKKDFENLEEFESEMKKVCYIKNKIAISKETKEKIIKTFKGKLYKITSYDLEKNDEEVLKKLKNKERLERKNSKTHTKIWGSFWTEENEKNKFTIRLNPEIKISLKEKDEEFIKNHTGLPFNRKFCDKYIFTTTFTQNALGKSIDLNFKEADEIIDFYKKYNDKFNFENKFQYFYGLDRGENELVTLGLFDFTKEKNKEKGVKIKVYELEKDYFTKVDEKGRLPYKNISYFTDEKYKDYFKEKEISCIDLTKAKLINGKIYINGDVSSYLNLKFLAAKRKIYDIISTGKNKSEKIKIIDGYRIVINGNEEKNEILYTYDEKFENIIKKDDLIKELQEYLLKVNKNLNDNEDISIEKINNLRDAICANMVGIISFLQQNYYHGMIFFEDFTLSKKQSDFNKNNTTLGSRIEMKLLQKFASLGQVPPNYKQIFNLQSDKVLNQLGIIGYVNKDGTSSQCPCCNKKLFGHGKGKIFENSMHHYRESNGIDYGNNLEEAKKTKNDNCDFHIGNKNYPEFSFINSGDDLATYNIAKKGLEYINNIANTKEIIIM